MESWYDISIFNSIRSSLYHWHAVVCAGAILLESLQMGAEDCQERARREKVEKGKDAKERDAAKASFSALDFAVGS